MLTSKEIRQKFLKFFENKNHTIKQSASLIPHNDPSLLFVNSGMVPFKLVFLGQEDLGTKKVSTVQKSLRVSGKHNDLENVGRTARHHTFFEMLGNFSFGDYFKKEAMQYAWEFVTKELKLDISKLYVTIYIDDDEAFDLWRDEIGVSQDRILRIAGKDNFWSMGDTGPCGPCSEIFIDQGEDLTCGDNCGIGKCDCDRFLEIWNLVFMQYNQLSDGTREPLGKPCIDTGMGLERVSAVCQGKRSNFDNDLFQEIIQFTANDAGVSYSNSLPDTNDVDTALRVIADHSRAATFLIAEGILPSNEGRGYVLRRLIRRALRFGTLIGLKDAFMYKTVGQVIELMKDAYPEIQNKQQLIIKAVKEEEERFRQTLENGILLLNNEIEKAKKAKQNIIGGDIAFKLYDTYGFPLDIVDDIARKNDFSVDIESYQNFMAQQKTRARDARKNANSQNLHATFNTFTNLITEFVGYTSLKFQSQITLLLDNNGKKLEELNEGEHGYVLTAQTPFYGESGGQVGDTGFILTAGTKLEVIDTIKINDLIVHEVQVIYGKLSQGQEVELEVTEGQRIASARNHTCTHILHSALKEVLGSHVQQAGSLVGPSRLRFDFNHFTALSDTEIAQIEQKVNSSIMAALPVVAEEMSQDNAKEKGAIALFGEKYGEIVRVVSIGEENEQTCIEFCGGTHLKNTGQAGSFVIISESGVAAGVRRIEAITGWNVLKYAQDLRLENQKLCHDFKARPSELLTKIDNMQKEVKQLRKEVDKAKASNNTDIMSEICEINQIKLLAKQVPNMSVKALRDLMDNVRTKIPSGIACLATEENGKVSLLLYVSKDLHQKFTAPALIKEISPLIDGSGGGRPDLAQAGGNNPNGILTAFEKLKTLIV